MRSLIHLIAVGFFWWDYFSSWLALPLVLKNFLIRMILPTTVAWSYILFKNLERSILILRFHLFIVYIRKSFWLLSNCICLRLSSIIKQRIINKVGISILLHWVIHIYWWYLVHINLHNHWVIWILFILSS